MTEEYRKKRVSNVTIACPFIYGSMAFYLGKRADEFSTHRWTLFLRGPNANSSAGKYTFHGVYNALIAQQEEMMIIIYLLLYRRLCLLCIHHSKYLSEVKWSHFRLCKVLIENAS